MDEIIVVSCNTCRKTVSGTVSDGKPVGFIWQDKEGAPQGRVAICDSCSGVTTTKTAKATKTRRSPRRRKSSK